LFSVNRSTRDFLESNASTIYNGFINDGLIEYELFCDFKSYLLQNLDSYKEIIVIGHSRGGIIGYKALEDMDPQQLGLRYKLITLAAPIHGSELAEKFRYALEQKSYLWVPVQLFLKFIFWVLKTRYVYNDLLVDVIPKDKEDSFVYHVEANYDLISGSLDKQHIKDTTQRTIINSSHPGLLFSKKAIKTVADRLSAQDVPHAS
jgi:pimeloyl-ACP methyl ester carboxylesterase